jgi:hypothetical protein
MQPVPLHMKLRCTGMEIPISKNFCPYNLRATSNKLYNKTIMQELEAFSFGWGSLPVPHSMRDRPLLCRISEG